MIARDSTPVRRAPIAPCVFFAFCRLVCTRFPKIRTPTIPPRIQILITNMTVPTMEASPAALSAAMDSYPAPVATISAAISSYVTEPTTDKRNHDHGTPRTAARLNRPMTMEMEGTME